MANMSSTLTGVDMQTMSCAFTGDKILRVFLVVSTQFLFIFVNSMMLFTLHTRAIFRETPRYILFAHMLLNDTIQLVIALVLYLFSVFYIVVVRAACAFIVLLSASTFVNAPLNLAVMSLERYTAICFPLRHSELATPVRAIVAVALVWVLGITDVLTDVCALFLLAEPSYYLSPSLCSIGQLMVVPWQQSRSVTFKILLFVTVAIVLLYTYVAILLQARAASTDTSSAHKALRTVVLHAFQLLLSLMSLLYESIDFLLARLPLTVNAHLRFLNYYLVLVMPRCLSSMIYGLRDKTFRTLFKQNFLYCGKNKVEPLKAFTKH
ncbi:odorant receptor 131-2-like [Clarias gariepinus]|uniref:odorant receptor 131-2-like n=1 Tax=Clarias gariepinus TaxID=13013 RepID=UPI00234DD38D|nr:odorant receptor 131-2-like [Clarias gariepinus]